MPGSYIGVHSDFVESEWAWVENKLMELSDDTPDEFDRFLLWEAVRVPKYGSTHTTQVRVSKAVK